MTFGADPPGHSTADIPDGVDARGVLPERGGRDAFILGVAITIALLGLIFTLGWIVYHRLVGG